MLPLSTAISVFGFLSCGSDGQELKLAKVIQWHRQQNSSSQPTEDEGPRAPRSDAKQLQITVCTHVPCSTSPSTATSGYWITLFLHLRNSAGHQKESPAQSQGILVGIRIEFPAFSFHWRALQVLGLPGSASSSSH